VEVRRAIADYEEVAPLYGFMRYRRRNVILKYMPEDCGSLARGELGGQFIVTADANTFMCLFYV